MNKVQIVFFLTKKVTSVFFNTQVAIHVITKKNYIAFTLLLYIEMSLVQLS